MSDWRNRLTDQLLGSTRVKGPNPDASALLEIAVGQARSELAYVLELGRAHHLPVTGSVNGDDMWIRVGGATLRINYSRRAGVIVVSIFGREDQQLRVNSETGTVVNMDGEAVDITAFVREAIDATVTAWKASTKTDVTVSILRSDRPPPPPTLPDSSEILPKS